MLNAIFIPPLQKRRKKPTIQDAQDSILVIVKTDAELQEYLADRFEGDSPMGNHPIIVAMAPNPEKIYFYVMYYNLKYRLWTLVEALDICFKMFRIFHVDFPYQCTQFYSFLNEMFYKLDLKVAKKAKIADLMRDLKKKTN